jgi:hypothetical protein
MHWGATTDSTIYKFDASVHELRTGIDATQILNMWKDQDTKIMVIGLYYIADGGYPKLKYLIPPFKCTQIGTKENIWSDTAESTRKDVERYFGIFTKIWRCLINPIEHQDPDHIKRLFAACAVLHNILLDYDRIDDWENRMRKAKFNGNNDTIDLNSVSIHQNKLMDDILYSDEGMNCPSSDSTDLHLDFHSNERTDHEMTFRLHTLIQKFFIAKEKKEIKKLKKFRPIVKI